MKNYQQTPKQRRIQFRADRVTAVKCFSQAKPKSFQPKEAWTTDRKISGTPMSVLQSKQQVFEEGYVPFSYMPRGFRRKHDRNFASYSAM